MQEKQTIIYYITGESIQLVKDSPFLERLKNKNLDCLYMIDPVDEYLVQKLKKYKGCKLVCVNKDNFTIEGDDDAQDPEIFNGVCNYIKSILGDRIKDVKLSDKLVDTPCCLVVPIWGWTSNMQRINKAQILSNYDIPMSQLTKMTLEINPKNGIILSLKAQVKIKNDDKNIQDLVWLMYDTALIDSGFPLENPHYFTRRIHHLINYGITNSAEEKDVEDMKNIMKECISKGDVISLEEQEEQVD